MNYTRTTHPIQQLSQGDVLNVHAYTFSGTQPGPRVYLQANLHGPEIFGTVLLTRLIEHLGTRETIPGTLTIVPNANPMGVTTLSYNGVAGRWNPQNGNNWNRIFSTQHQFPSVEETLRACEKTLNTPSAPVEDRLAATLTSLSVGSTYIVDIHTTGAECAPHVFTHTRSSDVFSPFHAPFHIEYDDNSTSQYASAFEDSSVIPFLHTPHMPHACTWEASAHNALNEEELNIQFQRLLDWLEHTWTQTHTPYQGKRLRAYAHLTAPEAGYYVWHKRVGDTIQEGEVYATAYQPWKGASTPIRAHRSFALLGIYGTRSAPQGGEIGWIAF